MFAAYLHDSPGNMTGKEKKTWETWSGKVVIKYVLLQIPATVLLTLVVILINQKLAIP